MEFFSKIGVPYFGALRIRILVFGVLYWGPLFRKPSSGTLRKPRKADPALSGSFRV